MSQPTGGVPIQGSDEAYDLEWSNDSAGYYITDLMPDTYYVNVTDWNNCSITDSVMIGEDSPMEIGICIRDSVQCYGYSNAILGISTTYATPPLQFNWDDGSNLDSLYTNVDAGEHTVAVIDFNQCLSYDTIIVPEPDAIESDLIINDAMCYDTADAVIYLGAIGGNGSYGYIWDTTLVEGTMVENQHAGIHELIITDRKNCELIEMIEVGQPDQIIIEATTLRHPECEFSFDGELRVVASGGTPGFNYEWIDVGDNGESIDDFAYGLGPGTYIVRVTDNHNCVVDQDFTLKSISIACLDIPLSFSPNEDGINERWVILNSSDENRERRVSDIYPELLVEIFDRAGQKRWVSEYGYDVSDDGWDGTDHFGKKLPMGSYYYFMHLGPENDVVIKGVVTIVY
jgi:gliding motility-associated-like protein